MQIISTTSPQAMPLALTTLKAGNILIFPTETCYGVAVDATNPQAVTQLLDYKGDRHRQVSIAVANPEMANNYVTLNSMATNLYREFLPGPITVISESKHTVDPRLESTSGTLGVRYPKHDFALRLIQEYGKPITATSANTSGKKEPYSYTDWEKYTTNAKQNMISLFLDTGKLMDRPTSTVVDTTLNDPTILRQGKLTLPTLSRQSFVSHSPTETKDFAATLLKRYLPLTTHTPLILALSGELGAGKTQFVQGLAKELGITDSVTSPTYTLMREYPYGNSGTVSSRNSLLQVKKGSSANEGTVPIVQSKYSGVLYHLDTWRLSDLSELDSTLHLSSLLQPGNILALEWAGKAKSWLDKYKNDYPILLINIDELDEHTREIKYAFSTPEWS